MAKIIPEVTGGYKWQTTHQKAPENTNTQMKSHYSSSSLEHPNCRE